MKLDRDWLPEAYEPTAEDLERLKAEQWPPLSYEERRWYRIKEMLRKAPEPSLPQS